MADSLRRSSQVVALGTLVSRATGLLREVVLAAAFGASSVTDVFFVAFRIPNTLRRLLAEGGVTVAVQPVYARLSADDEGERRGFERQFWTWLWLLGGVAATLLWLGARWWIPLFAAGFDPGRGAAAVTALRWLAPFALGITLVGGTMGLLHVRGRFFAAAAAPALLNLGIAAGAGWVLLGGRVSPTVLPLAWGALVGIGAWALLLWGAARRVGIHLAWARPRWTPSVRRVAGLLTPAVAGLAVYQLQVVVGTQFASFLPIGGVSALSYADRIVQLPLALIGTAVGTVVLPLLSRLAAEGKPRGTALGDALGWTLFLAVPATLAVVAGAEAAVELLYARGAFDAQAVARTTRAVVGYGAALIPASVVRVLLPALYAEEDMRTPIWTGLAALVVQAVLSWWWFQHDVLGLAAAAAGGSLVQAGLLLGVLRRRGHAPRGLARSLTMTAGAGAVAALTVWATRPWWEPLTAPLQLVVLAFSIGGSYGLCVATVGHPEWRRLRTWWRERRP